MPSSAGKTKTRAFTDTPGLLADGWRVDATAAAPRLQVKNYRLLLSI
jgi:hypothetical protein